MAEPKKINPPQGRRIDHITGLEWKEKAMSRTEGGALSLVLRAGTQSETRFSEAIEVSQPLHISHILSISPRREDHLVLRYMLDGVKIATAGTYREAVTFLCLDRVPVIVCERDLPDGTWKDILGNTAELTEPPALIVTSRLADDYLWAEVLNLGGYDVLAKPFREPEVKRVLAAALRQKTSQAQRIFVASAVSAASSK
jgi:hypothetical protein